MHLRLKEVGLAAVETLMPAEMHLKRERVPGDCVDADDNRNAPQGLRR
jgi:hypothetical protein